MCGANRIVNPPTYLPAKVEVEVTGEGIDVHVVADVDSNKIASAEAKRLGALLGGTLVPRL